MSGAVQPTTIPTLAGIDMTDVDLEASLGERFTFITGRAVPYGEVTDLGLFTEEVARGSFTESLASNPNVPLLWSHNRETLPIGVAEAWDDRPDGLWGMWRVASTGLAQTIVSQVRDGFIGGLSVGFIPDRAFDQWSFAANYDPFAGRVDHVVRRKARLLEVSLTPTPAFAGAMVTNVKAKALSPAARSVYAEERFRFDADQRLRSHDRDRDAAVAASAARARELAGWQQYLRTIRRSR